MNRKQKLAHGLHDGLSADEARARSRFIGESLARERTLQGVIDEQQRAYTEAAAGPEVAVDLMGVS